MDPVLVFLAVAAAAAQTQPAAIADVQPGWRDEVHTVWPNGPTHSAKLGGNWPHFSPRRSYCSPTSNQIYTGYHDGGAMCQVASGELDENPHMLLYSGWFALVFDAEVKNGNFMPLAGGLQARPMEAMAPSDVYAALTAASLEATLELVCSGVTSSYTLGPKGGYVESGLVRQGHTMTHIVLTELEWKIAATGTPYEVCEATKDPSNANCATDYGANSHPCLNAAYPECRDFQAGVRWGKCWSACPTTRNWWLDITMWGDHATVMLDWDSAAFATGCTGTISMVVSASGAEIARETASIAADNSGVVNLALGSGGAVALAPNLGLVDVQVTNGGTVLPRSPTQDVFVEVPRNFAACGYSPCGGKFPQISVVAANSHATEERTLRLSISRNFPTGLTGYSKRQAGAEITGMSVLVLDTATKHPTGIPCQISKNWHTVYDSKYGGYHGFWWTANSLLRMPANSSISLTFAFAYELYGGVSAYSHAQLSILGYSNKWIWEESALGCSGENVVFDPLGAHTRASITDVRVKLFDGTWKENVGGGEMFPIYFDEGGAFQYLKALDPIIHTNGPCLSNATYAAYTRDGALAVNTQVSGGRTDDFVRMFIHVRLKALKAFNFGRLAFFQMGTETYNKNANFDKFVIGSGATKVYDAPRTCTAGDGAYAHRREHMYVGGPYRQDIGGDGPWWAAFGPTHHTPTAGKEYMVVGDRGLVIRTFTARLGGQNYTSPTFSILCDKLELGPPAGVSGMVDGDFVDMRLEMMVLPKDATDYSTALSNNPGSRTLAELAGKETWERVQAQAVGNLVVHPVRNARVEVNYPVRVCSASGSPMVMFQLEGTALGYAPIVICDLDTHDIPSGSGLWVQQAGQGPFVRLDQSASTSADFYQVNYDRATHKYEVVFNIEVTANGTQLAFGPDPTTWPEVTEPAAAVNITDETGMVGDPHVYNLARDHFEIRAEGQHKLVQIPRKVRNFQHPSIRIDAEVKHLDANNCNKTFMTALSMFGNWTDSLGLLRISPGSDQPKTPMQINTQAPEEFFANHHAPGIKLGVGHDFVSFKFEQAAVHVAKHYEGRHGKQKAYLNFRITGLSKYKDVGGILGYDNHTEAETSAPDCVAPQQPSAGASTASFLSVHRRPAPASTSGSTIIAE